MTLLGPLCPCQAYESIEHVLVVIMAKYYVNRSTRSVINIGQTWAQKSLEFQSTRAAIFARQKIFLRALSTHFQPYHATHRGAIDTR